MQVAFNIPTPLSIANGFESKVLASRHTHYRFPRLIYVSLVGPQNRILGFCCLSGLGRSHRMLQGRSRGPNPVGFRREESYIGITTDKLASFVVSQ